MANKFNLNERGFTIQHIWCQSNIIAVLFV